MDTFRASRSFPLYKEFDVEHVSTGFAISDFSIMFDSVPSGCIQNLPEPLNTDVLEKPNAFQRKNIPYFDLGLVILEKYEPNYTEKQ